MTRDQLRRIILENRKDIKELILTDNQVIIIRLVMNRGTITSRWFSDYMKISIQNASAQLVKLYLKGYLSKQQTTSKTGGIENIFRSTL